MRRLPLAVGLGKVLLVRAGPQRPEHPVALPGSQVKLGLEIEADVPAGFERTEVRTLVENANTPGLIEKSIE